MPSGKMLGNRAPPGGHSLSWEEALFRILIVDADDPVRTYLEEIVISAGYHVVGAATLAKGLELAKGEDFDLVFLAVTLPDGSGVDELSRFTHLPSLPEVIIVTGGGDPDGAELAIRNGAWDYIQKRYNAKEILLTLKRALEYHEKKLRVLPVKRDRIIGSSSRLSQSIQEMARAARSNARVCILGETGTGKGLFARTLHENSLRGTKPFVVVDCAALQSSLAGSELFGHKKGSFTGAVASTEGLLHQAQGGTLFLDEVGELDLDTQKKFLGFLDNQAYRPLGEAHKRQLDFRLICATNKDLLAMTRRGEFREDLYYRIRGLTISLPALRERRCDIPELIDHSLVTICRDCGLALKSLSPELLHLFTLYDWPGNVRELERVIESLVASAPTDDLLLPWHLPNDLRVLFIRSKIGEGKPHAPFAGAPVRVDMNWKTFRETSQELAEQSYLHGLLKACAGDIRKAMDISGLSQPRLYSLLRKHGLHLRAEASPASPEA
jgi:two-component system NtrC family response regulator